MGRWFPALTLAVLLANGTLAQTTQGLIAGRLVDAQTGGGIAGAEVAYLGAATNTSGATRTDASGYYLLPLLPPGWYQIRAARDGYQAQEIQFLELPVAGRLDLNFRLRPASDVWEAGQYRSVFLPNSEAVVTFYGPDVDTSRFGSFEATRGRRGSLEASVSQVIDPAQVRDLPLAGRDVYTMLVTQPGVTADTTTARGLGLSINGQRPSASNFLLDGVENNNYLVTGPLTALAPEAVQEYRVSTSNFSAEYGRTAGFLANAVTHAGGSQWHGIGYSYLKNEALNANGFQENRRGIGRLPAKENQYGFRAGGPLRRGSVFASSAFEHLRSRGRGEPAELALPSTSFFNFTAPDSLAAQLLRKYPAPAAPSRLASATLRLAAPASVDRSLALERIDYQPHGSKHRVMGRLAIARLGRPDFIWTPYPDFVSALEQNTYGVAVTAVSALRPALTSEARAAVSRDDLHWNRPHPEVPTLASFDGVLLPGSSAFYEYRNRSRGLELAENLLWARGRHLFKAGGGVLLRRLDGYLTAGRDALYLFNDVLDFALDTPRSFSVALARENLPSFRLPDYAREYGYHQYFLFAQDVFRATPRLVFNYGLRYENFGAPRNTGAAGDAVVELGAGGDFPGRLAAARLVFGQKSVLPADHNDWGVRFGFSYDPRGSGRTVVRGGYGIFYDRPFDNLWQNQRNNNVVVPTFAFAGLAPVNYLAPAASVAQSLQGRRFNGDFPALTLFQPDLRSAYAQSYFFGVQREVSEAWAVEVNTLGALGRKLLTTDAVNRPLSVPLDTVHPDGRLNPALPPISYRANQGLSDYHALTVVTRRRARRSQFQLAYTWSHSIDNQSDPLTGDFFDLSFTRITAGTGAGATAAFARQFDSRTDRGNADFDQRHNLVFFSVWDLPAPARSWRGGWLLRDWKFSQLAAFRTGFPYTVNTVSVFQPGGEYLINNRADLVRATPGAAAPAEGGQRLLDAGAFRAPARGRLGNLGRNALRGPGLFNIDISLSRSLALPWLGEAGRATLRADVFNFLNHANLNNPETQLSSQSFGVALYGRKGAPSGFPAVSPLNETARQVQLMLRVEF